MIRTMPPAIDAPPPYTRAPSMHSPASSAASSLFSSETPDDHTYKYTSNAVGLNFSQAKIEGLRFPAYGRGGIIAGEVSLRSGHVESVSVSLRGEVKTVIESSHRPTLSSTITLLDQNHTLWSNVDNNSVTPRLLPFSLVFPSTVKDQSTSLPPSFVGATTEATIRIRYKLVVTVRRLGWRSNASVETEIFYLPRYVESTAWPSSLVLSPGESELLMESPYDLKIVPLVTTRVISGKPEPSQINAHFAYTSLISLSQGQSVPFNIWLSSSDLPFETLLTLVPHISVRLVRTVSITARGHTASEETVICQQSARISGVPGKTSSQVLNLDGCMDVPRDVWRSWAAPGAAEISYSLRVSLPASVRPDIAYIDHAEPCVLVAGNEVTPVHQDIPDFEAVPSPASLLKKPLFYMPMRV